MNSFAAAENKVVVDINLKTENFLSTSMYMDVERKSHVETVKRMALEIQPMDFSD